MKRGDAVLVRAYYAGESGEGGGTIDVTTHRTMSWLGVGQWQVKPDHVLAADVLPTDEDIEAMRCAHDLMPQGPGEIATHWRAFTAYLDRVREANR